MRAPPVYLTSTTPFRSESLRLVRRRILEKYGASWSMVNSRMRSLCTQHRQISLVCSEKAVCERPSPRLSVPVFATRHCYSHELGNCAQAH